MRENHVVRRLRMLIWKRDTERSKQREQGKARPRNMNTMKRVELCPISPVAQKPTSYWKPWMSKTWWQDWCVSLRLRLTNRLKAEMNLLSLPASEKQNLLRYLQKANWVVILRPSTSPLSSKHSRGLNSSRAVWVTTLRLEVLPLRVLVVWQWQHSMWKTKNPLPCFILLQMVWYSSNFLRLKRYLRMELNLQVMPRQRMKGTTITIITRYISLRKEPIPTIPTIMPAMQRIVSASTGRCQEGETGVGVFFFAAKEGSRALQWKFPQPPKDWKKFYPAAAMLPSMAMLGSIAPAMGQAGATGMGCMGCMGICIGCMGICMGCMGWMGICMGCICGCGCMGICICCWGMFWQGGCILKLEGWWLIPWGWLQVCGVISIWAGGFKVGTPFLMDWQGMLLPLSLRLSW